MRWTANNEKVRLLADFKLLIGASDVRFGRARKDDRQNAKRQSFGGGVPEAEGADRLGVLSLERRAVPSAGWDLGRVLRQRTLPIDKTSVFIRSQRGGGGFDLDVVPIGPDVARCGEQ